MHYPSSLVDGVASWSFISLGVICSLVSNAQDQRRCGKQIYHGVKMVEGKSKHTKEKNMHGKEIKRHAYVLRYAQAQTKQRKYQYEARFQAHKPDGRYVFKEICWLDFRQTNWLQLPTSKVFFLSSWFCFSPLLICRTLISCVPVIQARL